MSDRASIRIALDARACAVALRPRRPGTVEFHPQARVILKHARANWLGSRLVICTVAEARMLLDHFNGLAHALNGLGETEAAGLCAGRVTRSSVR